MAEGDFRQLLLNRYDRRLIQKYAELQHLMVAQSVENQVTFHQQLLLLQQAQRKHHYRQQSAPATLISRLSDMIQKVYDDRGQTNTGHKRTRSSPGHSHYSQGSVNREIYLSTECEQPTKNSFEEESRKRPEKLETHQTWSKNHHRHSGSDTEHRRRHHHHHSLRRRASEEEDSQHRVYDGEYDEQEKSGHRMRSNHHRHRRHHHHRHSKRRSNEEEDSHHRGSDEEFFEGEEKSEHHHRHSSRRRSSGKDSLRGRNDADRDEYSDNYTRKTKSENCGIQERVKSEEKDFGDQNEALKEKENRTEEILPGNDEISGQTLKETGEISSVTSDEDKGHKYSQDSFEEKDSDGEVENRVENVKNFQSSLPEPLQKKVSFSENIESESNFSAENDLGRVKSILKNGSSSLKKQPFSNSFRKCNLAYTYPFTVFSPDDQSRKNYSLQYLKQKFKEKRRQKKQKEKEEEEIRKKQKNMLVSTDHKLSRSKNPEILKWLCEKKGLLKKKKREEKKKVEMEWTKEKLEWEDKIERMVQSDIAFSDWSVKKHKETLKQQILQKKVTDREKVKNAEEERKKAEKLEILKQKEQKRLEEERKTTFQSRKFGKIFKSKVGVGSNQKTNEKGTDQLKKPSRTPTEKDTSQPSSTESVSKNMSEPISKKKLQQKRVKKTKVYPSSTRTTRDEDGLLTSNNDYVYQKPVSGKKEKIKKKSGAFLNPSSGEPLSNFHRKKRDPMGRMSYDEWLIYKRKEAENAKLREDIKEAKKAWSDPKLANERSQMSAKLKQKTDSCSKPSTRPASARPSQNKVSSSDNLQTNKIPAGTHTNDSEEPPVDGLTQPTNSTATASERNEEEEEVKSRRPEPQGCEIEDDEGNGTPKSRSARGVSFDSNLNDTDVKKSPSENSRNSLRSEDGLSELLKTTNLVDDYLQTLGGKDIGSDSDSGPDIVEERKQSIVEEDQNIFLTETIAD